MKVIDLYKKMASKEEMPKKIICNDSVWVYSKTLEDYISVDKYLFKNLEFYNMTYFLNLEVGIIEEKPKKIEEYKKNINLASSTNQEQTVKIFKYLCDFVDKINELTKVINYLLEKSDSE